MNKPPRRCAQCQNIMQPYPYQMATLDRCEACALIFLDSLELNFLTGRNLEQSLFQDPRLVTHCARCGELMSSPAHCGTLQQQSCSSCQSPLYRARVMLRVTSEQQGEDPYRGDAHSGGPMRYEHVSYELKVCLQCQGLLIKEELFARLLALFASGKRR